MTMTPVRRHALVAVSLANLLLFRFWAELFTVAGARSYFLNVSALDFLAVCLCVFALAAALFSATWIAIRIGGERGRSVVRIAFVVLLVVLASQVGRPTPRGIEKILQPLAPLVLLAPFLWRPRQAIAVAVQGLLILSPFAAMNVARAGWCVWQYDPTARFAPRVPAIGASLPEIAGPRVVVMIFDGLDRKIGFEDGRVPIPAFERLRAESIDATNVTHVADLTLRAIPSLLIGEKVERSLPAGPSELVLEFDRPPTRTARLSETRTLFQEAKDAGGTSVAVGWYHPYCRLFEELDACAWHPTTHIGGSHGQDSGLLHVMADQLATIHAPSARIQRGRETHERLVDAAEIAARSGGAGLFWLHLDVPHAPWIWNRRASRFRSTKFADNAEGYLDNLVLADQVFARLRAEMEATGKWDRTALLVTADHGNRKDVGFGVPDARVPFLLKLPGQSAGSRIDAPLSAIVTHDLVIELLHGRLQTPAEAEAWLVARTSSSPPPPPDKNADDDP